MIGGLVSEIQSLKRIKYESDLGSNEHYLCSGEIKAGTTFLIIYSSLRGSIPKQRPSAPICCCYPGCFFFHESLS